MDLKSFLRDHVVCLDGGMGTLLQAAGLRPGEEPERWNLTHAEEIAGVHRRYYDAGSNVVLTNTFGANLLKFSPDELCAIVAAAVENARRAQRETTGAQPTFVALDIGPCGRLLRPFGDFDFEDAVRLFSETVRRGAQNGVDAVFIETMNDAYETKAALLAAKEACDLPVFVSNAYGEDGKLMTGADPAAMVTLLEGLGADAIGVNCSFGPVALAPVVRAYLREASVPVLLKPNAGLPAVRDGKTVYDVPPDAFSDTVAALVREGVRIVGGCCGTTPDYIRALTQRIAGVEPVPVVQKNVCRVSSYTHAVTFGASPVLIGERINPTGKKRFQAAIAAHDMSYILAQGVSQQEKGAHVLDVNVGLPGVDEKALLTEVVCELQAVTDLPLQIDTGDAAAMESALRRVAGKAMINSVNGKKESMDAVFPLAKKYGGVVVALTLDENGIPETAQGRLDVARKILDVARTYGLSEKDLIFDPLALTVSSSKDAARVTLEAVRRIRTELGCNVSLGVSNVSFGLPGRPILNSVFFALALANGLSAAILNPDSVDMMKIYHGYRALCGLDDGFAAFIPFAEKVASLSAAPAASAAQTALPGAENAAQTEGSALQNAIVKGLKEQAAREASALLSSVEPLAVIENEILPALDAVGKGFEEKTVYLPQLLMSAEAASAAFERVKAAMPKQDGTKQRCRFVLATVKGDIHDIGKNIVRLLLENYGFRVTDLGKDVDPEVFVNAVCEQNAPVAGLSALMTTTVPAMEETIRLLKQRAPNCRVVVGGAVLTREYARDIGADFYAKDAMDTVRYAQQVDEGMEK